MAIVKLKRGNRANLPSTASPGEVLLCQDTAEVYFGNNSGNLVEINSYESVNSHHLYDNSTNLYTATDLINQIMTSRNLAEATLHAQHSILGGGNVTLSTNYEIQWSNRFIVIGFGKDSKIALDGYFDVTMPYVGAAITVIGSSPVIVTSSGIPMANWQALYYQLPFGAGHSVSYNNFFLYNYNTSYVLPPNSILIAIREYDQNYVRLWNSRRVLPNGTAVTPYI